VLFAHQTRPRTVVVPLTPAIEGEGADVITNVRTLVRVMTGEKNPPMVKYTRVYYDLAPRIWGIVGSCVYPSW